MHRFDLFLHDLKGNKSVYVVWIQASLFHSSKRESYKMPGLNSELLHGKQLGQDDKGDWQWTWGLVSGEKITFSASRI